MLSLTRPIHPAPARPARPQMAHPKGGGTRVEEKRREGSSEIANPLRYTYSRERIFLLLISLEKPDLIFSTTRAWLGTRRHQSTRKNGKTTSSALSVHWSMS